MKKLRILFPRVEAGYGHIVTLSALEEAFKKKYGDKFEIIDNAYHDLINESDEFRIRSLSNALDFLFD